MLHFHLPGLGVLFRQALTLPRVLHLQLEALQVVQLPAEVVNQLQREASLRRSSLGRGRRRSQLPAGSHLLHGLLLLLKLVAVVPELVHDCPVEVHLVLQPQTGVFKLVRHLLLLLQREIRASH